jgi:hypothetical protein
VGGGSTKTSAAMSYKPSAFELACCLKMRSDTFYAKTFFACQSAVTLSVVLLPLFVTNTASYGAAGEVCHDRTFAWKNATRFDVDHPRHDPEWDMGGFAEERLFPVHLFNSIATVISLFGFWVWLFFSPHNSDVARDLDRTCTKKERFHFFNNITHAIYYSCVSCFFLFSGQLFHPSVAGEPLRCCDSVRAELHAIRDGTRGSSSHEPPCNASLRHRDGPSVPSLPH